MIRRPLILSPFGNHSTAQRRVVVRRKGGPSFAEGLIADEKQGQRPPTMITVRRARERIRTTRRGQETLQSFGAASPVDSAHNGFRSLEVFREEWLAPRTKVEFRTPCTLEILTYIWKGALVVETLDGRKTPLEMGECHRGSARSGTLHRVWNSSRIETARIFQAFLVPDRGEIQMTEAKKRFSLAERRGVLRPLFSGDGRDASLRLQQEACVYSSILDPGHHLVHELASGRGAWIHVVHGRIQMDHHMLESGDGASFVEEPAVSLTAREPSEILLFDLV